jgi:hypothetical protein
VNREREYSLLSEEHRLRDAHTKVQNLTIQKDGTSDEGSDFQKINSPNPRMSPEPEWVGYTMGEVEQIRDLISCYGVNTIASIVACAREFPDNYITGNVIGKMCRDGHFRREGDYVYLLDEDE